MITFIGNSISTQNIRYSDTNCSDITDSLVANPSPWLITPGNNPISFKIGDQVLSANGATVNEIDFINSSNQAQPSIYLLQNSNSTLYLGLPCGLGSAACLNNRPVEIDYNFAYTKIN